MMEAGVGSILKRLSSIKWLIISTFIVLAITIFLSQISTVLLNQSNLSVFITKHYYFWTAVKTSIVAGFFAVWPRLVARWSKQYKWTEEQTGRVLNQRWRYVIWLTVIYFIFKLI